MSALADFLHKFGSQPRELKIGQSFFADDADTVFHTIRYDFVPASIDPNKTSAIDFGENGKVTITMPNIEGSGTTEAVYQGQRKPHQKECVLIINNETGDMILERLNQSMIVKKARLRQEDLTGKSLALNNKQAPTAAAVLSSTSTFPLTNGNALSLANTANSSTTNHALIKNINSNSDKKSLLVSHKTSGGQQQQNLAKKQSLSLSNGNMLNTSGTASIISRPNGTSNKTSTNISPPSMPVFNTNSKLTSKISVINSTNSNAENNLDRKIKIPDLHDSTKLKSNQNNSSNQQQTANCLSELSSSESSDSDAESSSDHFSDNENTNNKVNSISKSVSVAKSSTSAAPSMPSLVATLSSAISDSPDVLNDQKKGSGSGGGTSLTLSEDSDSSSSDDEENAVDKKSSFKQASDNQTINDSGESSTNPVVFASMPKFSQLSQDLQLSESDSDD